MQNRPVQTSPHRPRLAVAGAALLLAFVATPGPAFAQARNSHVSAEYLFKPGTIALTLSGGGAAFMDFQQNDLRLTAADGSMTDHVRKISGQTTGTASASISLWLKRTFGVALTAAYTPTHFRITTLGDPPRGTFVNSADTAGYAALRLWDVSGNLLLRPGTSLGRVYPYAIIGAGVVRYATPDSASTIPIESRGGFAGGSRTLLAGTAGIGAVIPLQRSHLLLAFDLTDHISRTPTRGSPTTILETTTGAVSLNGPPSPFAGPITLASNLRLTVGLTIPLRLR